ncbi:hypothetical protein CLV59_10746 [Chitinophaga dinghuensis]|uniref:Uncharacterized protein n=1 Tax=Chitinophaga dinghuensis TaxID=1539050 RepID=A0A327VTB7_9BACT|nr:hypothetical protein [Chitinophaga dinghuensis]RAJ77280.1 hypothetical protein CLV59_10746 [Chitinophaga dinghuensis]
MKLEDIEDMIITKEKEYWSKGSEDKIAYSKYVQYITNSDYFVWVEETSAGIEALQLIDKYPDSVRERVLNAHNKKKACADYNQIGDYYEMILFYLDGSGHIDVQIQKTTTKEHLWELLQLANFVEANLMISGDIIINESVIANL